MKFIVFREVHVLAVDLLHKPDILLLCARNLQLFFDLNEVSELVSSLPVFKLFLHLCKSLSVLVSEEFLEKRDAHPRLNRVAVDQWGLNCNNLEF